jgi:hypothetical protein
MSAALHRLEGGPPPMTATDPLACYCVYRLENEWGEPFYVGCTRQPGTRYKYHLSIGHNEDPRKNAIIARMLDAKMPPDLSYRRDFQLEGGLLRKIVRLRWVDPEGYAESIESRLKREAKSSASYKAPLTNISDGGKGFRGKSPLLYPSRFSDSRLDYRGVSARTVKMEGSR